MQTTAAKAAIAASGLSPEQIDTVVVGHIMTVSNMIDIILNQTPGNWLDLLKI